MIWHEPDASWPHEHACCSFAQPFRTSHRPISEVCPIKSWSVCMRASAADAAPVICAQVTTEEDLEIIFSRFGKITSCDIIRDYKTGALLGLAPSSFGYKNVVNTHMLLVNAALLCRRHARFGAKAARTRCNHCLYKIGLLQSETINPRHRRRQPVLCLHWLRQRQVERGSLLQNEQRAH